MSLLRRNTSSSNSLLDMKNRVLRRVSTAFEQTLSGFFSTYAGSTPGNYLDTTHLPLGFLENNELTPVVQRRGRTIGFCALGPGTTAKSGSRSDSTVQIISINTIIATPGHLYWAHYKFPRCLQPAAELAHSPINQWQWSRNLPCRFCNHRRLA